MQSDHDNVRNSTTTTGLPVSPSLGPVLESAEVPAQETLVTWSTLRISLLAIVIAFGAAIVAQILVRLIALITNISFLGRVSFENISPAENHLGLGVIFVPVIGGLVVGVMARWGSAAIRGHGIPEAMERILQHESKIPVRVTFLKPLSAAISIGSGGPFGAEGPIIATGGALGSVVGQFLHTTANERKTLLAAGAAAGMTATFGSPVSAVLLAIELLLFEYTPRSLLPTALACATAAAVRFAWVGAAPVFPMPALVLPGGVAVATYIVIGAIVGVASVFVTRAVYAVEDAFDRLPFHWMWWPALGAVAVGVIGYFEPHTMGVGYDNIENIVSGHLVGSALATLCVLKFLSWAVSLGSGTSGGTLAPLFTIGGGMGALLGMLAVMLLPTYGIDPRVAALVGMAALFAGASRALLASIVFAFETTRQPMGLLPLLGGCTAAYLASAMLMRESIMTTKIARRGVRVPVELSSDLLEQLHVGAYATKVLESLRADDTIATVRTTLANGSAGLRHQGFPVLADDGTLVGVVTRRQLEGATDDARTLRQLIERPAITVFADSTLREAVDLMGAEDIGRLPVVQRDAPSKPVGILTRSDVIGAYQRRLEAEKLSKRHRQLKLPAIRRGARAE